MALEGADQLPARRLPQLERLVVAAREHARAVGRERDRGTPPECPSKVRISCPLAASHSLSVLSSLPESTRVPSGENATDLTPTGVPLEGADQLPARRVPQLERLVAAAREHARAVGRERNRDDPIGVALEGADQPPARRVPQLERQSSLPESTRVPSGENATESTRPECGSLATTSTLWPTPGKDDLRGNSSLSLVLTQAPIIERSGDEPTMGSEPMCRKARTVDRGRFARPKPSLQIR